MVWLVSFYTWYCGWWYYWLGSIYHIVIVCLVRFYTWYCGWWYDWFDSVCCIDHTAFLLHRPTTSWTNIKGKTRSIRKRVVAKSLHFSEKWVLLLVLGINSKTKLYIYIFFYNFGRVSIQKHLFHFRHLLNWFGMV